METIDSTLFGQRLRMLRRLKGMTQADIFAETKILPSHLSRYENGTVPKVDKLVKLASVLETSLDYLMGRTTNPSPIMETDLEPNPEIDILLNPQFKYLTKDELPVTAMERALLEALPNQLSAKGYLVVLRFLRAMHLSQELGLSDDRNAASN